MWKTIAGMYLLQEKPDIKDITRRKSSHYVFLITTKSHFRKACENLEM
jgi:hypothetical protein